MDDHQEPTHAPPLESPWQPPQYTVSPSRPPTLLATARLDPDPDFPHNFPRVARWCADGSSVLVHCENRSFQLFGTTSASSSTLQHTRTFALPAPVLDFAWYPAASVHNPAAYCFVASLRASYKIVDHRERHVAPHSLAFNLTADRLYCGFEDAIEIFDVHRPGEGERMRTTPARRSRDGLKGIISALAFSPSYESDFYAAGSLAPASATSDNIALFSEGSRDVVGFVGGAGLKFNPTKPHILYAAFRRHEAVYAWDLRGDASVPVAAFAKGPARDTPLTNQKTQFDIDASGRWLGVGDQGGEVEVFDLWGADGVGGEVRPVVSFRGHGDTIGSVGFHPLHAVLLSVSGSRHFDVDEDEDDEGDSSSSSSSSSGEEEGDGGDGDGGGRGKGVKRRKYRPQPFVKDASMKLWSFDGAGG
ncbi:hypothetical protein BV22DRAFT_1106309 [Leucogyrophana mollusca]|uniref:Uncharacterized protein n=1 Tax=Leucogyrophana mollusca TaxID=85980 RepID=A0ACB8BB28_9AGAM|nr:hypothetical protein BV22DRAFT_1106309 [Leucogyrophana mollusca]